MPRASSLVPAVLVSCLAAACTQHNVYVRYGEVHRHLPELRATGQAQVATHSVADGDDPANAPAVASEMTTTIKFDRRVDVGATATTLRKLAEGCPDHIPYRGAEGRNPCALVRYRDAHFLIDTRHAASGDSGSGYFVTFLGLGAIGGGFACGFLCESHNEAKAVALIGGGLIVLTIAAIQSGARD
ncbi:MAG: hypothetical protein WKG01_31405 [Kofleriaceae bacterium]